MVSDTISVGSRTLKEMLTKEGLHELSRLIEDSLYQVFIGELPIKQKQGYVLDDPHVHYPYPKNARELEEIIRIMANKLGRSSITTWAMTPEDTIAVKNVLHYKDIVDNATSLTKDISLDHRGEVSIIKVGDSNIEIYPSQEIRTRSPIEGFYPHITSEGVLNPIISGQDARKTIEIIHKLGGLAIIEHNATKTHPYLQYVLTNPKENEFTRELFEMADATEVFNSYNTLWMFTSNSMAKREARLFNIAKIAGTDLHYGTSSNVARAFHKKRIGKAGIWLPVHDLQSLTGREILELKRTDLKSGNYERLETYTDPLTFLQTMIPPIFYRNFGNLLDKLGINHNLHTDSVS